MTAAWRGVRRELASLGVMLWDSTRPLTVGQREALEASWEQYLADREAFANSTEREQVAA
jgi:hypothetical protein